MKHEFWQHKRSGEVFAVELEGDEVIGCCGPLHHDDYSSHHPSEFNLYDQMGDCRWLMDQADDFCPKAMKGGDE